MSSKFIVANRSALDAIYSAPGRARIEAEIASMVSADAVRGIVTDLVYVDDAAQMAAFHSPAVTNSRDALQHKAAIDGIAASTQIDYLVLLGDPTLFPHVPLTNPCPDGDGTVPSDLPYACTAPYSTDAADFVGPDRNVSRIPGIARDTDPASLIDALKFARTAPQGSGAAYAAYFGVSADVWTGSSAANLSATFGGATSMVAAPPSGPPWTSAQYAAPMHFFHLHGATNDPAWYGEGGGAYPIALRSADVPPTIAHGMVVTVEACYGAQLYDPAVAGVAAPICNAYLGLGCVGFFGSTTISYGGSTALQAADMITQYFSSGILAGKTIGDAGLDARIRYVKKTGTMTPVDLKTLAQFIVLGDGSFSPVASNLSADGNSEDATRIERDLILSAAVDPANLEVAERSATGLAPGPGRAELQLRAVQMRLTNQRDETYVLHRRGRIEAFSALLPAAIVYVKVGERANVARFAKAVIEVIERAGVVTEVRVYEQR